MSRPRNNSITVTTVRIGKDARDMVLFMVSALGFSTSQEYLDNLVSRDFKERTGKDTVGALVNKLE
jgi:hypothetical protein